MASITTKQRAARKRNIKVAQAAKSKNRKGGGKSGKLSMNMKKRKAQYLSKGIKTLMAGGTLSTGGQNTMRTRAAYKAQRIVKRARKTVLPKLKQKLGHARDAYARGAFRGGYGLKSIGKSVKRYKNAIGKYGG